VTVFLVFPPFSLCVSPSSFSGMTSAAPREQSAVPEQRPYSEGSLIYGPEYSDAHPRFRKTIPRCKLSDEDARQKVGFKKSLALVEYEHTTTYRQYKRMPVMTFNRVPKVLMETDNVAKRCYNARAVPVDHIRSFVKEVKEYGFMSFDTEGQPRVQLLQVGSYRGTCFYFSPSFDDTDPENSEYDWSQLPADIRNLLSDEHIIKIQSDPWKDVSNLSQEGITVNSCVDTRLLFQYSSEFREEDPKTKLAVIVKKALKQKYAKRPHDYVWVANKLSAQAKKHMCQDTRAPLLFLVTLASQLSNDADNLAPFIMQLLFMHLDVHVDPTKFVKAGNIIGGVVTKDPNGPHDIKTVWWLLDTCPYYVAVEDFHKHDELIPDNGRDFLNQRTGANPKLFEAIQRPWEGSSPSLYDFIRIDENPTGWCPFCAKPLKIKDEAVDHSQCTQVHKTCDYPHCTLYEGHAVVFCPILHGICDICGRRGHRAEIHERPSEESLALHQIESCTLNWSPLGKLTCVPFLELTDRADEVSDKHWRYLTTNQKRASSQRMFAILSIPYKAPLCRSRKQRRLARSSDRSVGTPAQASKRRAPSLPKSGFKIPRTGRGTQSTSQSDASSVGTHTEPIPSGSGISKQRQSRQSRSQKGKKSGPAYSQQDAKASTPPGTFKVPAAPAPETERERMLRIELETLRQENHLLRMLTPDAALSSEQFVRIRRRSQFIRRFYEEARVNLDEGDIDVLVNIDMAKNPQFYGPDLPSIPMSQESFPVSQLMEVSGLKKSAGGVPAGMETESEEEYVPQGASAMDTETYVPSRTTGDEESADPSDAGEIEEGETPGETSEEDSSSDESVRRPRDYSPLTPPPKSASGSRSARSASAEKRRAGREGSHSSARSDTTATKAIRQLNLNSSESDTNEKASSQTEVLTSTQEKSQSVPDEGMDTSTGGKTSSPSKSPPKTTSEKSR